MVPDHYAECAPLGCNSSVSSALPSSGVRLEQVGRPWAPVGFSLQRASSLAPCLVLSKVNRASTFSFEKAKVYQSERL